MDALFDTYAAALPRVMAWAAEQFPRGEGEPEAAHARALKAKALDLLRGLLPAASLSHMGIFASGQTYEQLILHLLAHPLPEAQRCGRMILDRRPGDDPELRHARRAARPRRRVGRLPAHARRGRARVGGAARARRRRGGGRRRTVGAAAARRGQRGRPAGGAAVRGGGGAGGACRVRSCAALGAEQRAELLRDLVGARENRRHRPGRGFEALRYRFEIVSDYGAFRDLQRHRMLTCQWQALSPALGAGVPEEVDRAGVGDDYRRALEVSRTAYDRLVERGLREAAPYALCLGYRIRYVLDMNARAAMQLIELRSGQRGPPQLPRRRARHARAHRRGPPRRRRHDDPRRPHRRAAPGADPVGDADAGEAGPSPMMTPNDPVISSGRGSHDRSAP